MSIHNWQCDSKSDPTTHLERWGIRLGVQIGMHTYVANGLRAAQLTIPDEIECNAIIDTGCTRTAIDQDIANKLGLVVLGDAPILTAAGPQTCPVYAFSITIDDHLVLDCIQGIGCDLSGQNIGALIGMDLLAKCIMILNGPAGTFSLAK